jgi:hypothetical protein
LAALHGYALRASFYLSALESKNGMLRPPACQLQLRCRYFNSAKIIIGKNPQKYSRFLLVSNATAIGTYLVLNSKKNNLFTFSLSNLSLPLLCTLS